MAEAVSSVAARSNALLSNYSELGAAATYSGPARGYAVER
jgi:hypothetical protein